MKLNSDTSVVWCGWSTTLGDLEEFGWEVEIVDDEVNLRYPAYGLKCVAYKSTSGYLHVEGPLDGYMSYTFDVPTMLALILDKQRESARNRRRRLAKELVKMTRGERKTPREHVSPRGKDF